MGSDSIYLANSVSFLTSLHTENKLFSLSDKHFQQTTVLRGPENICNCFKVFTEKLYREFLIVAHSCALSVALFVIPTYLHTGSDVTRGLHIMCWRSYNYEIMSESVFIVNVYTRNVTWCIGATTVNI